jgi:DNA-directed DNA polymerase III (polc)
VERVLADGKKPAGFVHLRVKSAYSLIEGAIRPKELAKLCVENAMPAVAVTDVNQVFGVFDWTDTVAKAGVQPIVGVMLAVDLVGGSTLGSRPKPPYLPIYVQSPAGYQSLCKLLSSCYLDVPAGDWPHVTAKTLAAYNEGIIAITGGPGGPLNKLVETGQMDAAAELLDTLSAIYPNRLYVELQRHDMPEERAAEGGLIDLAYDKKLPLVATNDCHFGKADMYEAHDALLCIGDGTYVSVEDRRKVTPEHRFKSAGEMAAKFADLPEAIANTIEIAQRCAAKPIKRHPLLPLFEPVSGLSAEDELVAQAKSGLERRLAKNGLYADRKAYDDRLAYELDIIIKMKFPGYFLIVSDFMKWTRGQRIPVGVRGSGAASLVAWSLDITNLDPLRFGLFFERFLNPERISMPDFDIDFCQERREEVVHYVRDKYGHDKVGHILALGSLQARAAVRDVGRVLQMPLGLVDRIAKLIPGQPGKHITIDEAIEGEPRLQQIAEQEPIAQRLFDIARKLEGLYRNISTHPAGVIIGDRPLNELLPLYLDPRSDVPVAQFDYKGSEKSGLVKFDFLGLKTLTVIAKAQDLIAERGIQIDAASLDFTDVPTFEMLAKGDSVGVFQLESTGMRDLMRKMKPDRINDLVALVALYRPGPMDSIPKYIAVKNGKEEPEYLHPKLEPILKDTYGVMTYQEDVMHIAQELAGYTMGQADNLRRAMGKKIVAEMVKERERFLKGASERGVKPEIAEQIFDQAAKFAGYGFNKGHAAAYAHVAYQTAYLKAHYPVEFLAASMTLDMGQTDRLNVFRQEAQRLGISVLQPDVNRSTAVFSVNAEKKEIYYALAAIKGVGRQAMDHLVEVRKQGGPFKSMADFANRVDPKQINKRVVENLARAGAFDSLNKNRRQVVEGADLILAAAQAATSERESGQVSLFGGGPAKADLRLPAVNDWPPHERLGEEFGAMGFYLSGHPLDQYRVALKRLQAVTYAEVLEDRRSASSPILAGTVIRKSERRGKNDQMYAFCSFSDPTGMYEVMFFSEVLAATRHLLDAGKSVLIKLVATWEGDELKLRATWVKDLETEAMHAGEGLRLHVNDEAAIPGIAGALRNPGKGVVTVVVPGGPGEEVEIALPKRHQVTSALKDTLRVIPGVLEVESV